MLTHVDLFSGIGGFALACEWAGIETIAFAEIDDYASRVLRKHWPNVRNYGDVREFPRLSAWLLTAGVPCQPASEAGKRRGAEDDRWLWPATLAVVENGSYEWLVLENPTGILSLSDGVEFERVCLALEAQGYQVQPLVIPACGLGAPHRRNRVWIVAHSESRRMESKRVSAEGRILLVDPNGSSENVAHTKRGRWRQSAESLTVPREPLHPTEREEGASEFGSSSEDVAYTARERGDGRGVTGSGWGIELADGGGWTTEPNVGRVANGIPARVDRLRGLGNAIVPQVAYQLVKRMIEAEKIV